LAIYFNSQDKKETEAALVSVSLNLFKAVYIRALKKFCISAVVAETDKVAGLVEGIPGDVEPAGARQQLVGIGAGLEE
jgi:hypothetical protein